MKAYIARACGERTATVVFAESAGKARSVALHTDACVDANFTDIEVSRLYKADGLYRGKSEMDWFNPKDRHFLVVECGFSCEELDYMECMVCSAKEECYAFQEWLESGRNAISFRNG